MKTARWKNGTTLVEVVQAIVEHIDNPDIDYSINHGQFFLFEKLFLLKFCIDIGKEYMENRTEFNRKALEMIKKYGLPRN